MKLVSLAIQLKCPRLLLEKWQNIKNQQVRDTCWFFTYSAQRDESCYGMTILVDNIVHLAQHIKCKNK